MSVTRIPLGSTQNSILTEDFFAFFFFLSQSEAHFSNSFLVKEKQQGLGTHAASPLCSDHDQRSPLQPPAFLIFKICCRSILNSPPELQVLPHRFSADVPDDSSAADRLLF